MPMPPDIEPLLTKDQVLVPSGFALGCADVRTARLLAVSPIAPQRLDALAALSDRLLKHPDWRRDPAAVALGFWLRKSSLRELEKAYRTRLQGVRVPAGLVFHVTPANVDTMFVYSWALSFLAGNANVVRLTSRVSPLMLGILGLVDEVFREHSEACRGNWFVSFEHDDRLTARLSSECDLRMVWGGDETVSRLRGIPLNPHAAERSFASKRSFSVIDAASFLALEELGFRQLMDRFLGDVLPFGQMACSSPHEVLWVGPEESTRTAVTTFNTAFDAALLERDAFNEMSASVRRLNAGFGFAASGAAREVRLGRSSTAVIAASLEDVRQFDPCGSGLLVHGCCPDLDDVLPLVRTDHQTVTYFGFGSERIGAFAASAGMRGVDRVVPVGQALAFSSEWDGFDLWTDLTRAVTVR